MMTSNNSDNTTRFLEIEEAATALVQQLQALESNVKSYSQVGDDLGKASQGLSEAASQYVGVTEQIRAVAEAMSSVGMPSSWMQCRKLLTLCRVHRRRHPLLRWNCSMPYAKRKTLCRVRRRRHPLLRWNCSMPYVKRKTLCRDHSRRHLLLRWNCSVPYARRKTPCNNRCSRPLIACAKQYPALRSIRGVMRGKPNAWLSWAHCLPQPQGQPLPCFPY